MSKVRTSIALAGLLPAYLYYALMKRVVSLDALALRAWREPAGPRHPGAEARAIARVVRLAHLLRATDRDCIQRSLLLYRELSRAGAAPTLVVGFGRDAARVKGHAWIVVDGRPVAETAESLAVFTPAMTFGRKGLRGSAPGVS